MLCDIIHPDTADVLATYGKGEFYQDTPVITTHQRGEGKAYYVGTMLSREGMREFFDIVLNDMAIPAYSLPEGVEWKTRVKKDQTYHFLLNHTNETIAVTLPVEGVDLLTDQSLTGTVELAPFAVKIITPEAKKG